MYSFIYMLKFVRKWSICGTTHNLVNFEPFFLVKILAFRHVLFAIFKDNIVGIIAYNGIHFLNPITSSVQNGIQGKNEQITPGHLILTKV